MKSVDLTEHAVGLELFNTIFEQDAMGMALRAIDPKKSCWLQVNQKFCDMLGYTREELLQLTSVDISLPDERDLSIEFNEQLLRDGLSSYSREKRYLRKDGTVIWTNIWLSVVRDRDGNPTQIISVIHDITEQKRAEEVLREAHDKLEQRVEERTSEIRDSEKMFSQAARLASLGHYVWDESIGRSFFVSDEYVRILGITVDQALTQYDTHEKFINLVHPDDRERALASFIEYYQRGNNYNIEYRIVRPDGEERYVRESGDPVVDHRGQVIRIVGILHDITDMKLAELDMRAAKETAEAAEELLSKVYQSTPALLAISAPGDGHHYNVNNAWSSITGYSRDEALQKTVLELNLWVNPEDRVKFIEAIRNQGFIHNFETMFRTKYGVEKDMLLSGEFIDFRGEETLLVVGQDITKQKQAEKELKEAHDGLEVRVEERTAELEQINIELEQFTYAVSHDLKSPLVTINGFIGLLGKDLQAGDDEGVKKDMQHIISAISWMGHLLDDLLELSRIGRVVNEPQSISLNQISNEAILILQGILTESEAKIEIAPAMPAVIVDKNRIIEVMQNLLENAIKFCGKDNTPKISVDAEIQGSRVQCRVKDNGIGIDPRYRDKVFDLFDRLDPDINGYGVGLALVKRIIEVHNGKVWIESEGIGQGTQVCFTLPAASRAYASSKHTGLPGSND